MGIHAAAPLTLKDAFVFAAGDEGELACLYAPTGFVLWKTRFKAPGVDSSSGPAITSFVNATDGVGFILGDSSGAIHRIQLLPDMLKLPPTMGDHVSAVSDFMMPPGALEGGPFWERKAENSIYAGPALSGELLAVGSFDG